MAIGTKDTACICSVNYRQDCSRAYHKLAVILKCYYMYVRMYIRMHNNKAFCSTKMSAHCLSEGYILQPNSAHMPWDIIFLTAKWHAVTEKSCYQLNHYKLWIYQVNECAYQNHTELLSAIILLKIVSSLKVCFFEIISLVKRSDVSAWLLYNSPSSGNIFSFVCLFGSDKRDKVFCLLGLVIRNMAQCT